MFHCVVIDDQKEAISLLEKYISKIPNLNIALSTTNPVEGLDFIKANKVNLLFLDMLMPNYSGIEFIASVKAALGDELPKIIFTTGFEKYAMEGYNYEIVDFLLKPFSFGRFQLAMERFFNQMKHNEVKETRDFVYIETSGKKLRVLYRDLLFIQADRSYLEIYTASHGMLLLVNKPLSFFEKLLSKNESFLRINRSFLINIEKIIAIKGNVITLDLNGKEQECSIGKTYKDIVFQKLDLK